jgi:anti-sigma factor RsiW
VTLSRDAGVTADVRVSDLTLERYRLGDLPADDTAALEGRVATDAGLRSRLDALAQSDAEIQAQYSPEWMAQAVAARAAMAGRRRHTPAIFKPRWVALAGAAGVMLALLIWMPQPPDERVKGEAASLIVYRRVETGSELLSDGDNARRGDIVRVAYRAANPCFGVIVSIDGRGTVTRHLPQEGAVAAQMQAGEVMPLDTAYELDDAPKWERFFLVTGDRAFEVEAVMEAVRRAAASIASEPPDVLLLPDGLRQSSFLLRKGS